MARARTQTRSKGTGLASRLVTVVAVLVLLAGVGMVAYPSFSNWWNQQHQTRAVMGYVESVAATDSQTLEQMLSAAQDYNQRLAASGALSLTLSDAEQAEYDSLLDVDGTGIMGYVTIPKIDVQLPIYHGTDDAVLQTSIGHLEGTSLPVGGESTHAVLSGHRGLPSARLFTDLDQLVEGDTFTVTVLDQTLTYQVDQISVVEPTDLSKLQIEQGEDLCTLVTCTPYGINTHRLLVRGHRVPNANGDAQLVADAVQLRSDYLAVIVGLVLFALVVAYVLVATRRRVRGRHGMEGSGASAGGVEARWLSQRGLERPSTTASGVQKWRTVYDSSNDAPDGADGKGSRDG